MHFPGTRVPGLHAATGVIETGTHCPRVTMKVVVFKLFVNSRPGGGGVQSLQKVVVTVTVYVKKKLFVNVWNNFVCSHCATMRASRAA